MYMKTLKRIRESIVMYTKTPNRIHETVVMYMKTPNRVHMGTDMHSKTPIRVHDKNLMHPKNQNRAHKEKGLCPICVRATVAIEAPITQPPHFGHNGHYEQDVSFPLKYVSLDCEYTVFDISMFFQLRMRRVRNYATRRCMNSITTHGDVL